VHGTGDDNVHVQNSVQMIHRMVQGGIAYDLQLYPRQNHGIRDTESRVHLFRRMTRFLLDHL
jgi:dipeptidyl-peptidase-4